LGRGGRHADVAVVAEVDSVGRFAGGPAPDLDPCRRTGEAGDPDLSG